MTFEEILLSIAARKKAGFHYMECAQPLTQEFKDELVKLRHTIGNMVNDEDDSYKGDVIIFDSAIEQLKTNIAESKDAFWFSGEILE